MSAPLDPCGVPFCPAVPFCSCGTTSLFTGEATEEDE